MKSKTYILPNEGPLGDRLVEITRRDYEIEFDKLIKVGTCFVYSGVDLPADLERRLAEQGKYLKLCSRNAADCIAAEKYNDRYYCAWKDKMNDNRRRAEQKQGKDIVVSRYKIRSPFK